MHGTGKGTGTGTGIATVTVTVNGTRTGTETMIVTVIVTVIAIETANATERGRGTETETGNARESETATVIVIVIVIAKRIETVVPGTTAGTRTTHVGHRVTMAVIANAIGRVTRRETVETESVIGTRREDQVRGGMTRNGAVERTERKIELVMTNHGRNESLRLRSEVRRYAVYRFLTRVLLTLVCREQDTM
jgi:hypothetical protein